MIGISCAAVLLAVAAMLGADGPRRRLMSRRRPRAGRLPGWGAASATAASAILLLPVPALIAAAIGAGTLLRRRRRARTRHRATAERRALVAALEVLIGELRVGAHPVRAFDVAAGDADGPVGAALAGVAARARLGADVVGGLRAAAARSPLAAEWERMALAWQLAAEHGMAISAMMRAAHADIVERQRFWSRVQASMAGARATAGILAALPIVGVALGEMIGAAPLAFLFGRPAGGWLLVVGTALMCAGLCWADRITDGLPS